MRLDHASLAAGTGTGLVSEEATGTMRDQQAQADVIDAVSGGINFVQSSSKNYVGVQENILGVIKSHLPAGSFTDTVSVKAPRALNFSLFVHQPTDVLMSHGVADKNYFLRKDAEGNRIANTLKYAFVPGEWLKRRLLAANSLNLTEEQILTVGWPRLDHLLELQKASDNQRKERKRPLILWAPTHDFARRGPGEESISSYPELSEHLDELRKHFDVEISLHPRNRPDKKPTRNQLIECDYVISDFGTMVYEAWALGKPVIFPYWIIGERIKKHLRQAAEAHIFRERIGIHADSVKDIVEAVNERRGLDDKVKTFLDDYLPPQYLGCSGKRVADLLLKFAA